MKRILEFALFVLIFVLMTTVGKAQDRHVIFGQGADAMSTKPADFAGTVVGINFDGNAAQDLLKSFSKAHAKEAYFGPTACTHRVTICVTWGTGPLNPIQGSSYNSGYGMRGGFSNQASFSGSQTAIVVDISLVTYDEQGVKNLTLLAEASRNTFVGMSSETISSYGNRSGGTFGYNTTSGLGAEVGGAIKKDVDLLFEKNIFKKAFYIGQGVRAHWEPGAASLVRNAFAQQ